MQFLAWSFDELRLREGSTLNLSSWAEPGGVEWSGASSIRPWPCQMLRAAQHDNTVERVSIPIFLVRHSLDFIRIILFRMRKLYR